MQEDIERYLEEHVPGQFTVSEIAAKMKISRSSAQRQLKKLAAKGRITTISGKYTGLSAERTNGQSQLDVGDIARRVGLDPGLLEDWVSEKRADRTGSASAKALKKILRTDAEGKPRPD